MEKSELQKIIGINIQKARIQRNMTRDQLAEKVGISTTFLANLECGNKMMSVMNLQHLADALCVSTDMLLYGDASHNRMSNMNALLRNQSPEMIQYLEKLVLLGIEIGASTSSAEVCDDTPLREVKSDGSGE